MCIRNNKFVKGFEYYYSKFTNCQCNCCCIEYNRKYYIVFGSALDRKNQDTFTSIHFSYERLRSNQWHSKSGYGVFNVSEIIFKKLLSRIITAVYFVHLWCLFHFDGCLSCPRSLLACEVFGALSYHLNKTARILPYNGNACNFSLTKYHSCSAIVTGYTFHPSVVVFFLHYSSCCCDFHTVSFCCEGT